MLLFIVGLFCFLVVIGFFVTGNPFKFAAGSLIALVGTGFALLIVIVLWSMTSPCTAPFSDHNNSYCQKQVIQPSTTSSVLPSNPLYTVGGTAQTATANHTGVLPTIVGSCDLTTVSQVGTRLMDGTTNAPIPGTGSAIWYADKGYQVSYEQVPGIDSSQVGDEVKLCLVSVPSDCPPGDDRGKVYSATNVRTGATWQEQDAEHSCGGA